jgi:hypothetical protein
MTSMTWPAEAAVVNSGISARSHMATRRSGGQSSATMMTGGSSVTMREMRRSSTSSAALAQVGHLAAPHDLHPVRVDVVQVADQVGRRLRVAQCRLVKAPFGVGMAGDPLPMQGFAVLFEQPVGRYGDRLHAADLTGCQAQMS